MSPTTMGDATEELIASMSVEQLAAFHAMSSFDFVALQASMAVHLDRLMLPTKTFAIPELLEQILAHLEFTEIFIAMRVNRSFLSTVLGSTKLKRDKLFMQPAEGLETISSPHKGIYGFTDINPYIHRMLASMDLRIHISRYITVDDTNLNRWKPLEPTLYLSITNSPHSYHFPSSSTSPRPLKAIEDGTWRNIYVTAFPLRLLLCICFDEGHWKYWPKIEARDATLGTLFDAVAKTKEKFAEDKIEVMRQRATLGW